MFCLKRCKYLSRSACLKPLFLKTNGKYFLRCLHSEQRDINTTNLWVEPTGYNTGIKIYNPILKENVDLILRTNNVATWYSCGPTVYDSAHIGHASCYVKFDIIRRILEKWFDINTILLMGITDVDDKIIKRANEIGVDYACISRKYELEFFRDLDNLNVLRPSLKARVTEHIPKILDFINKIIAEGHAYIVPSGSVYFQTSKFERYNKFGMAASVDSNESNLGDGKISPSDFALWKAAKPGEPFWDSPWGAGRPGWHIECSAIASTVFGRSIDIHSGGIDLKFPHHENEEAQSCSHHCVDQWVNYWIYSGHLNLKGDEKMSKSLKNTLLIKDFLKQYSANEFRTMCLMSHYRSGLEYSEDAIKTASSIYKRIESFLHTCDAYLKGQFNRGYVDKDTLFKELEETRNDLYLCFTDDFNTPKALSSVMELISKVNWMFNEESEEEGVVRSLVAVAAVSNFVKESCTKLGFNLVSADTVSNAENVQLLTNVLDTAVEFRSRVREIIQSKGKPVAQDVKAEKQGLYKCCDEFRDHLINLGIQLEDHGEKSSWKLKNNVIQDENSYKR